MEIPKFKFNTIAIIEVVVIVILLPMSMDTWSDAISNMQYTQHLKKALAFSSVGKYTEMELELEKAGKAREEDSWVQLYQANHLFRMHKTEQAKKIYHQLMRTMYEDTALPRIGFLVCELRDWCEQAEATPGRIELLTKLNDLEKEAQNLCKESPYFSEGMIFWGQVALQKARWLQQSQDTEKAQKYLDLAWQKFQEVQKLTSENAQLLPKMDVNQDGKISIYEWRSKLELFNDLDTNGDQVLNRKELFALWSPPSYQAMQSLYTGQASICYERTKKLWQSTGNITAKQAQECIDPLNASIRLLQSSFALHNTDYIVNMNIARVYNMLLTLPGISVQERQVLIQKAEEYLQDLQNYIIHLQKLQDRTRFNEEGYVQSLGQLYYGLALAYYYVDNSPKAQYYLGKAENVQSSPLIPAIRIQLQLAQLDKEYLRPRQFVGYSLPSKVWEYHVTAFAQLPKDQKWTSQQFVDFNNYLVLMYMQSQVNANKSDLQKCQELMGKYLHFVPDADFSIRGIAMPVSAKQLLLHNRYMVMRDLDPKKAVALESQRLQFIKK